MYNRRRKKAVWTSSGSAMLLGVLFFTLVMGFSSQCQAGQAKGSEVVARWGNHVITQADLDASIKALPANVQQKLESPQIRQEFLENLVQIRICAAEARLEKLDRDKRVKRTIQDLTDSVLLQEYLTKKIAALKKPSDKEIEAYYQANKAEFAVPAMVQAQHILIKVEKDAKPEAVAAAQAKAEGILKEAAAGEDFTKLVEKYSEDEGSKANGGDLGKFSKDQMVPEFAEAAFSLKKGEVSKVVKTGFGLHIIKVNETEPSRQMELKEVSESIAGKLYNQNREKLVLGELERLKKKYKVSMTMPAAQEKGEGGESKDKRDK